MTEQKIEDGTVEMHGTLRRLLVGFVVLSILLPVLLGVVLGLSALLASLGDESGAVVCGRLALGVGVVWVVVVIGTAISSSMIVLNGPQLQQPSSVQHAAKSEAIADNSEA
ncbi:MAG: hypothetical protein WCI09_08810 [Planctomycetota bacterium]